MKGIDADDARRKREDNIIELRKNKRDENLQKKRMIFATGGVEDSSRSLEDSNRNTQKVSLRTPSLAPTGAESKTCLGCKETHVSLLCLQLDNLPSMVQGVYSEDVTQQLEATMQFRKLLSIGALLRLSGSFCCTCMILISWRPMQSGILPLRRSSIRESSLGLSNSYSAQTISSSRHAFMQALLDPSPAMHLSTPTRLFAYS